MKAPKTIAGRLTEAIMRRVDEKLPELTPHDYNRIFEAVLAGLCHTEGVAVVPDNDWAFMAKISAWPKEKKKRFYVAMNQLFPEAGEGTEPE